MFFDEKVVNEFPWKSSRTPNYQCRISIRKGREGTRNVYIDALDPATGNITKGIYFRSHELPDLLATLQKANELLNG